MSNLTSGLAGGPHGFKVTQSGGTSATWSTSGGNATIYPGSVNDHTYIVFLQNGSWTVYATVTNSCGSSGSVNQSITISGGASGGGSFCPFCNDIGCGQCVGMWSPPPPPYPNPVSDVLYMEIDADALTQSRTSEQVYDVRLLDGQGNMLRQTSTKGGTIHFDVSNLPHGVYFVHVYDGVNPTPEIHQVVVER